MKPIIFLFLALPLSAQVSIAITPSLATVARGATRQFTITVSGTGNYGASLSISPAVGTIATVVSGKQVLGTYTAPLLSSVEPQTIVLTATSHVDTTRSATALITLSGVSLPACTPGTSGGVTVVCNVPYDTISSPSGQAYARTMVGWFPANGAANATNPVLIVGAGKGFTESNISNYTSLNAMATALVVDKGYAVYAPYTTLASEYEVANAHDVGDTSLTITDLNGMPVSDWWPNLQGCALCAGTSVPFVAIYGANTPNQEFVTITAQDASGKVLSTKALTKTHGSNEAIALPRTQFPAPLADAVSFFNWAGANLGQGTYPGNPKDMHIVACSSDAWVFLLAALVEPGTYLNNSPNNSSWWGGAAGVHVNSNNIPSDYTIRSSPLTSVPWDLNYMQANATAGAGKGAQNGMQILLGCKIGIDTNGSGGQSCTDLARLASPTTYLPAPFYIYSMTGMYDFTTPACGLGQIWPACLGNMYEATGTPFLYSTVAPDGHGLDYGTVGNVVFPASIDIVDGLASGRGTGSEGK